MEALRGLDPVAYVRFASVYRDFREAADFQEVLSEIAGEPVAGPGAQIALASPCHRCCALEEALMASIGLQTRAAFDAHMMAIALALARARSGTHGTQSICRGGHCG